MLTLATMPNLAGAARSENTRNSKPRTSHRENAEPGLQSKEDSQRDGPFFYCVYYHFILPRGCTTIEGRSPIDH